MVGKGVSTQPSASDPKRIWTFGVRKNENTASNAGSFCVHGKNVLSASNRLDAFIPSIHLMKRINNAIGEILGLEDQV